MSLLGGIFILDDMVKNRGCNKLDYPNITEENDICYDDLDKEISLCNLYYDKAVERKYPVLLNIHGGGWIVGDKKYRRGYSLQIANAGLFVISINYGLAPKYQFPYGLKNAFSALRWIERNAEKYNLDLTNVFISGDSAGGHLAASTCVAINNEELRKSLELGETKIKIKSALFYCGVYDFSAKILRIPVARVMLQQLTGTKKVEEIENFKYYKQLSPIDFVTKDFPRTMVVSGKQDFFTDGQYQKLIEKFKEYNIPYIHYHATDFFNCFHCFYLKVWMKEAKNCMRQSIEFIKQSID